MLCQNETYPFRNMPLPYAYDALEPSIDGETMRLHHERYLQGYIDRLNGILKNSPFLQGMTLEELLAAAKTLPPALREPVCRNAGGVFNHRFYFSGMSPDSPEEPVGELNASICRCFGSFERFRKEFKEAALSVFGSGYAWLCRLPGGALRICTTPNQQTPLARNMHPVLNVDVWEHAYFLKHVNLREEYVNSWFQVVDWNEAESRYLCALTT